MPTEQTAAGFGNVMPYLVFGLYIFMLLTLGFAGWRKFQRSRRGEEDYYLAGRSQGWIVSSLTIMATFFSSFALLGVPGTTYKEGVVFALFALNVPIGGAVIYCFGAKIARIGRARNFVTPADMFADYYASPTAMRLLVALIGFLFVVPYVIVQLKAGGILAEQLFGFEYAFEIGTIVLAATATLYIIVGGMRSVGYADVVQGSLLVMGMLLGGATIVWRLGGPEAFFEQVSQLPRRSLTAPGTTGRWAPWMLMTAAAFGALGSLIQPAQWMRFYAASSTRTLRRSAIIFTVVLTSCYIFGVMLVGLGGQVQYPIDVTVVGETVVATAHPAVGSGPQAFDQILIVIVKNNLPAMLGVFGAFLASMIMIAIMAAAMSTADANVHVFIDMLTSEIYTRFIAPRSSEHHRVWVGRIVIFFSILISLILVFVSRNRTEFAPIQMLTDMALLGIAFSTQMLPATVDMLYLHKATRSGIVWGMIAGVIVVFLASPFGKVMFGGISSELVGFSGYLATIIDRGAIGLIANLAVCVAVSSFTRRPSPEKITEYIELGRGRPRA